MVLAHSCQFTRGMLVYIYRCLLQVIIVIIIIVTIIIIIITVLIDWSDALANTLQGQYFAQSQ